MARTERFDLVILGSGSTAFAAALRAQELGKTSVMIEERTIGGTCVNRGCLPSKNLIGAARLVHDAKNPRYPGLTPSALGLDFKALIAQKDEVVHAYRKKKYESLVGGQFSIKEGHVAFVDAHTVEVNGKRLTGDKVLIATGSRSVVPAIEGLSGVPYLTSDLLTNDGSIELTELPRSLVIVGGGYIALELWQMFRRFGSEVTILERNEQLLAHGYEPEVERAIGEVFEEEGIRVVTGAMVQQVRSENDGVIAVARVRDAVREACAERLLIATGRRPNTDAIAIERAGVALNREGAVLVNEYLQTNLPHIFAAGDVIGRETGSQMATPVGSHDGGIAALNALSGEKLRAVNHAVIPRAIFTDPQVGLVGLTEEEAIAKGQECWCNTVPMSLVPRAGAIRDTRAL